LTDPDRLPCASQFFGAVIGSGILEHSARDGESLRELYRVLKPRGVLVITYLPNRLSIHEWLRRVVWRRDFHRRLYGLREIRRMLLHHGFYPPACTVSDLCLGAAMRPAGQASFADSSVQFHPLPDRPQTTQHVNQLPLDL